MEIVEVILQILYKIFSIKELRVKQKIKNEKRNTLEDVDKQFKSNLNKRREALVENDDSALATDLDHLLRMSVETETAS